MEDSTTVGTVSLIDAAARLGISESHARNLVSRDQFPVPVIRMGRVMRVPTAALDRLLAGNGAA